MINFSDEQEKLALSDEIKEAAASAIELAAKEEGVKGSFEVDILVVDNEGIREINSDTREKDEVTDVLSFPMIEYKEGSVFKDEHSGKRFPAQYYNGEELMLGDIVISLERASEQAAEFGHSLKREFCYLVVHSMLHLLGYDHMEDADKARMRKREEDILGMLEIIRE
jgi:probable rRNA maturation factor